MPPESRAAVPGSGTAPAASSPPPCEISAEELLAAVPLGRGEGPPIRSFSAFTGGLHALRDWLLECGINTVAMESTGNYWLCACIVIEGAGIEVCLVNARHVKGVPGKKTGVCDVAWPR